MIHLTGRDLDQIALRLNTLFLEEAQRVTTRYWQGLEVSHRPEMTPYELLDVSIELPIHMSQEAWAVSTDPNMPWAEQHFQERVSGIPHNPPPSHEIWPHAQASNEEFRQGNTFSHTYPERFWPKLAAVGDSPMPLRGIRFDYGDLDDVVDLMVRDPYTRQAFLPVWFPEDTGAHHGERVPCTLGYLFRYRNNVLSIVYYIRSCDFRRHFRDDVYLAGRLAQWMAKKLRNAGFDAIVGQLVMHIGSFHVFEGDIPFMKQEYNDRLSSVW